MAFYHKYKLRNYFVQAMPHLNDIIAIKLFDENKGAGACITWGRIYKEKELLDIIKNQCLNLGFENLKLIEFCYSLQDIAQYPYFYEQWIYFAQQDIPYKNCYKKWVLIKRQALLDGHDIKFTGFYKI